MDLLISQGSLALIFLVLLAAGLGVPIPEDIPLVAAGVLAYQGAAPFWVALLVCAVGVMAGDTMIFLIARRLGPKALDRPFFKRLLPPARRERITGLFARWGGGVIFGARHVAGLRAPTFAFAGMHGMKLSRFLFWDFLGLCVSAPWMLGIGYWFAGNHEMIEAWVGGVRNLVMIVIAIVAVVIAGKLLWNRYRAKRDAAREAAQAAAPATQATPAE
jgi:membrane protein DedA with SNARE-associated domain